MKIFLHLIFVFSLFSLTFLPNSALAQAVTPADNNIIALPQFSAGEQVNIDQPVNKDLFAAGGQIDLKADVNGDVYVGGGQINIDENINGDLIVAGGNVTINGQIQKNLIVAGGQVKLSENATVTGYLLAAGGNIDISGRITGPVKLAGGNISVTNTAVIGGNLEIDGGEITVSDQAQISGERKITRHENRNIDPTPQFDRFFQFIDPTLSIVFFLGQLIVLLLLIKLIKRFLNSILKPAFNSLLNTLGWGLIALIITPFLILILLISVIGLPLSFILTALYLLALYFSGLFTAIFFGNWIASKNWIKTDNVYLQAFLGLLVLSLLGLIPYLGFFIKLFSLLLGLGLILNLLKSAFQKSD